MRITTIGYDNLPGFSKLFLDFINGNSFFDERFPNNKKLLNDKNFLYQKSHSNQNREILKSVISTTMSHLNLNDKQKYYLNLLKNQNTLAVVTGQQVGFLGGPLYTLVKALSAAALSEKLNILHKEFLFIPIFWIEDNDHDNLESSQITIYDKNYNPVVLNCDEFPLKTDRRIISSRNFDNYINTVIEKVTNVFKEISEGNEIINELNKIYLPSKSWTSAFVEFMNHLIGSTGILFISASLHQRTGLFYPLVKHELENSEKTNEIIKEANSLLEFNHYHIQAKTSKVNLFFHRDNFRYKIEPIEESSDRYRISNEVYSRSDLISYLDYDPTVFSPNVLLRPVFQDFALPTVAYVAGPSEIGYISQIKEIYEFFNVKMPAFIPRHSISIIEKKISRFLEKNEISPEYFFRKIGILRNEIDKKFRDLNKEKIITNSIDELQIVFDKLKTLAKSVDPTLEATVDSSYNKTKNLIEVLGKKINSAEMRQYDIVLRKFNEASQFLYPINTFQERIYSPVNFLLNTDKESLIKLLLDAFTYDPNCHYFIYLD